MKTDSPYRNELFQEAAKKLSKVSDDTVDAIAKALYQADEDINLAAEKDFNCNFGPDQTWDQLPWDTKNAYRFRARRAYIAMRLLVQARAKEKP